MRITPDIIDQIDNKLDDAVNHTTPGVNKGMYDFMLSKNKDDHLAAFAHCYNKAFFTTSKTTRNIWNSPIAFWKK